MIDMDLKLYSSVNKGSQLKVRKFWALIPSFGEITDEKLVMGGKKAVYPEYD